MRAIDPIVTEAVRAGGVAHLDERGLMPLAEARALVRETHAFDKGEGRTRGGVYVLDSDAQWAALLSLEDAGELVREASRLEWRFHPRGMENVDLYLRYGEGIVPWLATRIDESGRLVNMPWCVLPCLLACSSAEAFEVAWSGSDERGEPLRQWLARHPVEGLAGCARRAAAGETRGRDLLAGAILRGQRRDVERAVDTLEPRAAESLRKELGLSGELGAAAVLAHLDACAEGAVRRHLARWPRLDGEGALLFHGLRLLAARGRDGGWGVLLERLQGAEARGKYPARIAQYAFGSHVPGGVALTSRPLPLRRWPSASAPFVAALRRDVAEHPEEYWLTPAAVVGRLRLGEDVEVVADCTAFCHVVGARAGEEERDARAFAPSQSPAYRTLADALVHRDPARFVPGESTVSAPAPRRGRSRQ